MSDPTDDQSQPRDVSSNRPEETGQPASDRVVSYLDFEMEIAQGHGREYPVAVVKSPAGEARETLKFPFDELALENRLKALQIALLRSGGSRRQVLSPEEHAVQNFGRELFNALVTGEARSRYDVSVGAARQQGKGLRLKLRILPPELAKLPWEFLYDPREAEYVCLSRDTPVVRYLELPQPVQPLLVQLPLRILGMIVSPRDLPSLDVAREKQRVETALGDLQKQRLIDLKWLEGQTWRDLQRAMRSGPWHIFHFIGHGGFDSNADEGVIALADENGCAHRMLATELGRLLSDHRSLRLALLNSCEGARGSEHDVFSSTAAILVRRGLPAVVAMQYEITDRAAVEFARSFYEALAEGLPVDAAVAEARKAISLAVTNTVEWGTPVLYMRAPQGAIFQLPETPRVRQRVPSATPLAAPEIDKELEQRLEQLFTEGLAAFWVEDWDKACRSFQAIVETRSDYPEAAARLEEARRQRRLNGWYVQAQQAQESRSWPEAIAAFEMLTAEAGDFKGATGMLRSAKAQKQLADLYAEARRLSQAKQWQAVVNVFAQIAALQPDYADPDGLLPAAQKEVAELKRQAELNELYRRAVREMDARRWPEAQKLLAQVQQAEPGFREADRLLARAEAEIAQEQAEHQRQEQLTTLYEQAIGLARARQWRQALAKMQEVQQLDPQFADAEGIAVKAQSEIEREEQETQRQSELAALYAEAVRLLKANKYQAALEKWGEVQARDPKYPDRQHVSITAKKKLGALAKPVPRKRQLPKRTLALIGGAVVVVAAVIAGLIYFNGLASRAYMYDDFNSPAYDGNYNKNLWEGAYSGVASLGQYAGVLTLSQDTYGILTELHAKSYKNVTLQSPIFFEAKLKLDPDQNAGHAMMGLVSAELDTNCMLSPSDNTRQVAQCWLSQNGTMMVAAFPQPSGKMITPGSWHTFRIEFYPSNGVFTFFMDGERIGAYAVDAAQLQGAQPTFTLRAHKDFDSPAAVKGYFDDVRIGPLENGASSLPTATPTLFESVPINPTSVPSAVAVTATSRPTPLPTATIDADPTVYDNFNNPAFDGSFNPNQWTSDDPSGIAQRDGVLVFTVAGEQGDQVRALWARQYSGQLKAPTFFEAKLRLDPNTDGGDVILGFNIHSKDGDDLGTICHIMPKQDTDCGWMDRLNSSQNASWGRKDIASGTWHTFRIEIDPTTSIFSCFIDGQAVYSGVPPAGEKLRDASFAFYIQGHHWGQSLKSVVGYIDDVRIGPLQK